MGYKWQFRVGGSIQAISDGNVAMEQAVDGHQHCYRALWAAVLSIRPKG